MIRHFNSVYALIPSAAALLDVVANYGRRIFAGPSQEVDQKEIGEFAFHNGILLPHRQYLYGSSETGEPFIVGKKLAGKDYSAWEAEYGDIPRLKSLTLAIPESTSTYSWSFEAPKASTSFNLWQPLLWVVIGTICAFLLRYLVRKVASIPSSRKHGYEPEVLALPISDIDVEYSKLYRIWRSTLIGMYRERKSDIMSLSKLALYYMNSSRNLRKLLTKEKKKKGKAKNALAKLKAEHTDRVADLQREFDNLKQMLDTKSNSAKDSESTNGRTEAENTTAQETNENMEDVAGSENAVDDPGMGSSSRQSGKPRIPRANTRGDGSIRTPSHPDYVPLEDSPSQLGDKPFRPAGHGNGLKRGPGRGGRGRGENRGGNRGGHFGWRGGRHGVGIGGANAYNGQPDQGGGQ